MKSWYFIVDLCHLFVRCSVRVRCRAGAHRHQNLGPRKCSFPRYEMFRPFCEVGCQCWYVCPSVRTSVSVRLLPSWFYILSWFRSYFIYITSVSGQIGGIAAPWIGELSSVHPSLPTLIFGVCAILGTGCILNIVFFSKNSERLPTLPHQHSRCYWLCKELPANWSEL